MLLPKKSLFITQMKCFLVVISVSWVVIFGVFLGRIWFFFHQNDLAALPWPLSTYYNQGRLQDFSQVWAEYFRNKKNRNKVHKNMCFIARVARIKFFALT